MNFCEFENLYVFKHAPNGKPEFMLYGCDLC